MSSRHLNTMVSLLQACILMVASVSLATGQTRMIVADAGTSQVHRVVVSETDYADYTTTTYDVPDVSGFKDLDYDFLDDRLYFVKSFADVWAVNVDGSNPIQLASYGSATTDSIAVDPYDKIVFVPVKNFWETKYIVAMNSTGGEQRNVVEVDDPANLAADYVNKYLYWSEYDLTGNLYRIRYDGTERETVARQLIFKRNVHGIDFNNNIMYADGYGGVYAYDIEKQTEERILARRMGHPQTVMTFDPRTNRLFLVNTRALGDITVYNVNATNAVKLGRMGMNLTKDKTKAARVNPLPLPSE